MTDHREQTVRGIMDVLQRVYGDATQTELDRQAAGEVLSYVLSVGMAPLETVACIIKAAGGSVTVPISVLTDPPSEVGVFDDPETMGKRFFAR